MAYTDPFHDLGLAPVPVRTVPERPCAGCPATLAEWTGSGGVPLKYCSQTCRMRAWRQRHRVALRAHRELERGPAPAGHPTPAALRDAQAHRMAVTSMARFDPLVEQVREALDDLDVELAQVERHWRKRKAEPGRDVLAVLTMRDVDGAARIMADAMHELRQYLEGRTKMPRRRLQRDDPGAGLRRRASQGGLVASITAELADGQPHTVDDLSAHCVTKSRASLHATLSTLAASGRIQRIRQGVYQLPARSDQAAA